MNPTPHLAVPAAPASPERRSARERLLAAADELFYAHGIHTVGIDRVIEHAGVAKASLYDCFGSKDDLIRAYLQARHEARKVRISNRVATGETPRAQLLAVFDALGEAMAQPTFRGCAFARVRAEAAPSAGVRGVCDDARHWLHALFAGIAGADGVRDPLALARQLVLLYDGASVGAQMDGGDAPAHAARDAAALLFDAAPRAARRRRG